MAKWMSYSCSATPKTPNHNLFSLIMNSFFYFFFGGGNTIRVPDFDFLVSRLKRGRAIRNWKKFPDCVNIAHFNCMKNFGASQNNFSWTEGGRIRLSLKLPTSVRQNLMPPFRCRRFGAADLMPPIWCRVFGNMGQFDAGDLIPQYLK